MSLIPCHDGLRDFEPVAAGMCHFVKHDKLYHLDGHTI